MLWIIILVVMHLRGTTAKSETDESYSTNLSKYEEVSPIFVSALPACNSFTMCHPVRKRRTTLQNADSNTFATGEEYSHYERKLENQARSYYNSFGFPAYYPTFDPISVLAILAFLAFLVQSFASLFDRSRALIPTISKQSTSEYDQFGEVEKRVLRALNQYDPLDDFVVADKESIQQIR